MQNPVDLAGASPGSREPVVATDTRMDPELKAKWVAALRSGKYAQGYTHLELDGRYCCLGVLRKVANPNDHESVCGVILTRQQERRYGLPHRVTGRLTRMNDEECLSFQSIAVWIEGHL